MSPSRQSRPGFHAWPGVECSAYKLFTTNFMFRPVFFALRWSPGEHCVKFHVRLVFYLPFGMVYQNIFMKIREATKEEAKVPLQEWRALMVIRRAERQARDNASKKAGGGDGGGGGPGGSDGKGGDGKGSHGSGGRRSKHAGRMSSRRKKYRRNEFQQMQQQEVRHFGKRIADVLPPSRMGRVVDVEVFGSLPVVSRGNAFPRVFAYRTSQTHGAHVRQGGGGQTWACAR